MWLFINLGGAQEDSQREEFNRNLKPKFHDRCPKFCIWFSLASGCCHKLSKATSTNFDVFLYILLNVNIIKPDRKREFSPPQIVRHLKV